MQPKARASSLDWLEFALLISPFLFLAARWGDFPARVPIHWNIHGKIDGLASRPFGLLLPPIVNIAACLALRFLRKIDPKFREAGDAQSTQPVMRIIRFAVVAFLFGVTCFQYAAALGHSVPMDRLVYNGALLLLVVTGNYFAVLRPNYFAGIRTPWTLRNPLTWRATHRAGGRIMVFGALFLIAAQFFISRRIFPWVFIAFILGFSLWSIVYSWNHSRTHAQSP